MNRIHVFTFLSISVVILFLRSLSADTQYPNKLAPDGILGGNLGVVVKIQHPTVTQGLAANGGPQESSELFRYNSYGQVTQQTDAEGKVTQYTYYPATNPTGALAVTDPPAGASGVTGGQLNSVVLDPTTLALTTAFQYNSVGNLTQKTDANGRIFTYFVNEHNQITKMLSPVMSAFTDDVGAQYETITWYDANGNVEKTWVELENSLHDTDADVSGFESPSHYETQYTYDILDNVTKVKREAIQHSEMKKYVANVYVYDENENVVTVKYSDQGPTDRDEFVYDERDLVWKQKVGVGDPNPSVTRYNYGQNGKITKVIPPNQANTVTYSYNGLDLLTSVKNEVKTEMVYSYDNNFNVIQKQIKGRKAQGGPAILMSQEDISYDAKDRVFQSEFLNLNLDTLEELPSLVEQVEYLKNNQVNRSLNALNRETLFTYDTANRLKTTTDAFGNLITYNYDNNSNVLSVVTQEKTQTGGAEGTYTTTSLYDELNRVRQTENNLGHKTKYKRDSRGIAVRTIDAEGNFTKVRYDGLGRPFRQSLESQPGNPILQDRLYDKRSRVVKRVDGRGNATLYGYDSHNRLILRTNSNATTREYTYDESDNLLQLKRENGHLVERFYDEVNRLTNIRYTTSTGAIQLEDQFLYNGLNQLLEAKTLTSEFGVNNGSRITYKRDNRGLMIGCTQQIYNPNNSSLLPEHSYNMTYNEVGNPKTMEYSSERTLGFPEYNNLELPTRITTNGFNTGVSGSDLAQYEYSGFGRMNRRLQNQMIELKVTFDPLKRVNTYNHKINGALETGFNYKFNKVHSPVSVDYKSNTTGDHYTRVTAYDKTQRAIGSIDKLSIALKPSALADFNSVSPSDGEDYQQLTYDPSNNIEQIQTGSTTIQLTHNAMNELTSVSGVRSNLQYDTLGRLIGYTEGNDEVTLAWNMRDQLISFSKNGIESASFDYYPSNTPMRSIVRTNGGKSETFYGAGDSIHEIYEIQLGLETSEPTKEFVYEGIDSPLAIFTDADQDPFTGAIGGREAYFLQANARGDIYSMSDESGNVIERYDYTLSGKMTIRSASLASIPQVVPPSGSSAVIVSGQPYLFTALVSQVSGEGTFTLTFVEATGTASFSSASVFFDPLTVGENTGQFQSEGEITGITGEGTITATLTYSDTNISASSTFILTVIPTALSTTLDFSPASPINWELDDGLLILKATGSPEGGVYAIDSISTSTGGTFSAIDPDTGAFTFSGATTSGTARIDLSYTLSGETARGSILINALSPTLQKRIGRPFGFGGAYQDHSTGLTYMRHRYYDPILRRFLSRDPAEDDSLGNLYAAFENNPGRYRDPTGLDIFEALMTIREIGISDEAYEAIMTASSTLSPGKKIVAGVLAIGILIAPLAPLAFDSLTQEEVEKHFKEKSGTASIIGTRSASSSLGIRAYGPGKNSFFEAGKSGRNSSLRKNIVNMSIEENKNKNLSADEELDLSLSNATQGKLGKKIKDSKQRKTFSNKVPQDLDQELELAEILEVKPSNPYDSNFEKISNQGTIKWAIDEKGNLVVIPKYVQGQEIPHSVLTGGKPVLAAGEAEIATSKGVSFGLIINRHSGHFEPDEESLRFAVEKFKEYGIEFGEINTEVD